MVPQPGTPEDRVEIKQEPVAGAPYLKAVEYRPVASWSSVVTFTTGHGTSDYHEGYEEPFSVPDVAPPGATTYFDASGSLTGLKLEGVEDQQRVSIRAKPEKRKPKKKKQKMRAPESEDGPTTKIRFIKPKLLGEFTGPFHELDFSKLTSVRLTIEALFAVLRESGFVLGAFEMQRVYDWNHESGTDAIHAILDPLTVLVGTTKRKTALIQGRKPGTRAAPPPPRYPSSEDSDSSVEFPKRMSMRQPARVMQLAAIPAERDHNVVDVCSPRVDGRPDGVDELALVVALQAKPRRVLGRSLRSGCQANVNHCRGLHCYGRRQGRAQFNGKDASEEKARAWFNRRKAASKRDVMTGDEVCALFEDRMIEPARQLQKSARTSWTALTDRFRVQYCGKSVSTVIRYYHASKHVDETSLKYLYRLNVAGIREKIRYANGTSEEKREHVKLFINTLGAQEQELASRVTLMEVPDTA
ncbi:LOW QUALITY PROTEIN: hypothetical protein PHMEG_00015320, partial [Phytophthora megakarya]